MLGRRAFLTIASGALVSAVLPKQDPAEIVWIFGEVYTNGVTIHNPTGFTATARWLDGRVVRIGPGETVYA